MQVGICQSPAFRGHGVAICTLSRGPLKEAPGRGVFLDLATLLEPGGWAGGGGTEVKGSPVWGGTSASRREMPPRGPVAIWRETEQGSGGEGGRACIWGPRGAGKVPRGRGLRPRDTWLRRSRQEEVRPWTEVGGTRVRQPRG